MTCWIRLSAALLAASIAAAQSTPDAAGILKRVEETYRAATQYELESSAVLQLPGASAKQAYTTHLWYSSPDKYRLQSQGDFCAQRQTPDCPPGAKNLLNIYRGRSLWIYSSDFNQYRKYSAPNLPRDSGPDAIDLYAGAGMFRHATELFMSPHFLREDRLAIGGGTADCYVLQAGEGGSSATVWIDKNRNVVLRMDSNAEGATASITYSIVKLNQPNSGDLFDFKPPAGAKLVEGAFGKASQ